MNNEKNIRLLVLVYLYSLLMLNFSSVLKINIQYLIRFPFINVKLIDLVIILYIFLFLSDYITRMYHKKRSNNTLNIIILIYIIFSLIQFTRTGYSIYFTSKFALLLSSLTVTILYCVINSKFTEESLMKFIGYSTWAGAVYVLIIITGILGLNLGFSLEDENGRVSLLVVGANEVISTAPMYAFATVFSLFKLSYLKKGITKLASIIILAILSASIYFSFHRGNFITWVTAILFFLIVSIRRKSLSVLSLLLILGLSIFAFTYYLDSIGMDPLVRLQSIIDFTFGYNGKNWDKGRVFTQIIFLEQWLKAPFFGYGYSGFLIPASLMITASHNILVSSLWYHGIIGTLLLFAIWSYSFKKSLKLWQLSNKDNTELAKIFKALCITLWLLLIPVLTQEVLTERYFMSFFYLIQGIIIVTEKNYKTL